jgi:hypothetical protein
MNLALVSTKAIYKVGGFMLLQSYLTSFIKKKDPFL